MKFFSHFGSCRLFVRVALSLSVPGFSVHPVAAAGAYHATPARSTGFSGDSQAQYWPSLLNTGTHTVTEQYGGATYLARSSSSTTPASGSRIAAGVALAQSSTSSVEGQEVTFTATILHGTDGGTPTGSVEFWKELCDPASCNPDFLGSAPLSGGAAALTLQTHVYSSGYRYYSTYGGDSNYYTIPGYSDESAHITHYVTPASTTISVGVSPSPSTLGQTVKANITYGAVSPGSGFPTGTITVYADGTPVEQATVTEANKDEVIIDISADVGLGHQSITAAYSGNGNYYSSNSAAFDEVVNPAVTSIALSSSLNPSAPGQAVTFSATITEGGATNPTGTVTFRDGSTTLGTSTVTSSGGVGKASFTTASLTAGSHPITASYSGDANDQSSSSNTDQQVVGSPTAALVSAFHAYRQGSHATFVWRMAIVRDVSGFNVYAGMHKLNAHAIRVHAAHRYIYTHRWAGNSSFSLHVLLTNGREVVMPAERATVRGGSRTPTRRAFGVHSPSIRGVGGEATVPAIDSHGSTGRENSWGL